MRKIIYALVIMMFFSITANAQVRVNTTAPSSRSISERRLHRMELRRNCRMERMRHLRMRRTISIHETGNLPRSIFLA